MATQFNRNVIIKRLRTGDPVGSPLADRAYLTRRHPDGVTVTTLKNSERDLQRETALFWFFSNFKTFELGPGPYFGFGEAVNSHPVNARSPSHSIAGWDQATWAPAPIAAATALDEEFAEVLADDLRRELGEALSGEWMPIESEDLAKAPEATTALTEAELRSTILKQLDALAASIRSLGPAHGEIGHNLGIRGSPLTTAEQAEALREISNAKEHLERFDPADPSTVPALAAWLKGTGKTFLGWVWQKLNLFIDELIKSAARNWHWYPIAIGAWRLMHALNQNVDQLARLVH